ncbi:hypothetical protein WDZ92_53715 [Nostoc sp. NIES-2111]
MVAGPEDDEERESVPAMAAPQINGAKQDAAQIDAQVWTVALSRLFRDCKEDCNSFRVQPTPK